MSKLVESQKQDVRITNDIHVFSFRHVGVVEYFRHTFIIALSFIFLHFFLVSQAKQLQYKQNVTRKLFQDIQIRNTFFQQDFFGKK